MSILMDIGAFVLVLGTLVCVVGGIGLIRLPNFFARTHGGSVTDTLGATLALLGMIIYTFGMELAFLDQFLVVVKLISIGVFLLVTSPIAGHALTRAAYRRGIRGPKLPVLENVASLPSGIFGPAERREILEGGIFLEEKNEQGEVK
mgnify:CR=1 FL=1